MRYAALGVMRLLACMAAAALLPGCERVMRDMYEQPKYDPLAESPLWPDGRSARPLQPGVVVRSGGPLAAASSGRFGAPGPADAEPPAAARLAAADENPQPPGAPTPQQQALTNPLAVTLDVLERGRDRYAIFCTPCHSALGDGDGMVVRRGFPAPPTLHSPRLRSAPDGLFFEAITRGYGVMYPFGDRISPSDRWAIVAYIRALQLSQNAKLQDVPAAERAILDR